MSALASFMGLRTYNTAAADAWIRKKTKGRSQRMHDVTVVLAAVLTSLLFTLFATIVRALLASDQPGSFNTVAARIRDMFIELCWWTMPIGAALGLALVLARRHRENSIVKKKE